MIDAHKMAAAIADEIEAWGCGHQVRIHLTGIEITPIGRAILVQTIRRELASNQDDMQPRENKVKR